MSLSADILYTLLCVTGAGESVVVVLGFSYPIDRVVFPTWKQSTGVTHVLRLVETSGQKVAFG